MALGAGRRKRGGAADRQELVARLVGSWLAHDYDTFDRAVDDALRAGRPGAFAVAAGQVADAADRGLSGGDAEDEDALADAVDELGDRPDEAEAFLAAVVDRAGTVALDDGRVAKLVAVPALIDRDASRQETLPFLEQHEFIRPLSDYDQFVHDAFLKEVQR